VLDLVPSESASFAHDTDYDLWHSALGHSFKTTVNWNLPKDGYLIPDYLSNFTCNLCALSKSKHQVPKPVEAKSTEVFELRHTDICGPVPNESYGSSKYYLTIIDDFSGFSWVFFIKRKLDTSITHRAFFTHDEREFAKMINPIRSDKGSQYISNELKYFFIMIGVIHELTLPYSPESNGFIQ
jgi:transposase InsO family protein